MDREGGRCQRYMPLGSNCYQSATTVEGSEQAASQANGNLIMAYHYDGRYEGAQCVVLDTSIGHVAHSCAKWILALVYHLPLTVTE